MARQTTRRAVLRGIATGTALVAAAGQSVAQEGGETHVVDMTDELVFDPDSITVAPGDTIRWENVGTVGHSVTAYEDGIPDGTPYWASGGFDAETDARAAYPEGDVPGGEAYEHTFETTGTFEYFCIPHESVGMVADVVVQEGGATPEPTGRPVPQVPDVAKTIGVGLTTAMVTVVALAYFFLKYGGDYEPEER